MSNYLRSIPAAMLGVGMVMSSGGCSYVSHETDPSITRSVSPATDMPTASPTPEATAGISPRQQEQMRLLGSNATINVIYIAVSNAPADEKGYMKDAHDAFRTKLLQSDPKILAGFTDAFDWATYGRFHPKVQVTEAAPIALADGCIDNANAVKTARVDLAASLYSVQGDLNVVALDADPCDSVSKGFSGYGSVNIAPVMDRKGFMTADYMKVQPYADVIVHEGGHSWGGLNHAGKAECADPIAITDCTVDVTADQNSVMSYEYGSGALTDPNIATRFTAPELEKLGLLKESEVVVNPAPGTVELVPIEQTGTKLIVIQEPGKSPKEYISFETDPYAAYTIACEALTKKNQNNKNILYQASIGNGPTNICYKTNETDMKDSVQVRFPIRPFDSTVQPNTEDTSSLAMVDTRKDSTDPHDLRDDASVANGYNTPNTVIFSDDTLKYTYASFDKTNKAVIAITPK